ncbi:MAG: sulfotransferase [Aequorivita antarctica]
MKEEQLIFIISQPRSGSTYLQNLLSNNTEVNTCSEPWLLLYFANQIKPSLLSADFNNQKTEEAFQEYLSKFPQLNFEATFKDFLLKLYAPMYQGFTYVIDKTPRYWELIEELPILFPKSKILIIKRNPVDVLISIIKTWNLNTLRDLNEYRNDILLAPHKIQSFVRTQKNNPNVCVVKYEDVIDNPQEIVKNLYQWIGLEYSDAVLQTGNNEKYKGKFGDPFQNADAEPGLLRQHSKKMEINPKMQEFIMGYKEFLSSDFLKEYGSYSVEGGQRTDIFNTFLNNKQEVSVNTELQYLKNSTSFKLGRLILAPYRIIKNTFLKYFI